MVGPNGAGKTTLMSMLNGYRWPTEGTVEVLGSKFGECDLRELRTRIGMVSSFLEAWVRGNERVLELVVSGKYGATRLWKRVSSAERRRAVSLLKVLGCEDHAGQEVEGALTGREAEGHDSEDADGGRGAPHPRRALRGARPRGAEKFLGGLSRLAKARLTTMVYVTHRTDEIPPGFNHALLLKGGRVLAAGKIESTLTAANLSACFELPVRLERLGGRYYTLIDSKQS